jgi:hypothetical protein
MRDPPGPREVLMIRLKPAAPRRCYARLCTKVTLVLVALSLTALPRWAKSKSDRDVDIPNLGKACNHGKPKACEELAKIATEDRDTNSRKTAASLLRDRPLLAKIAVEDKEPSVRMAAIVKLTDQTLLAKIAAEDKEPSVRMALVRGVVKGFVADKGLLAKIAVEGREAGVRSLAVANLADQALLAKIAVEDSDASVRIAAVEKLTDHASLAMVALEDKDEGVRKAAKLALAGEGTVEGERKFYIWRAARGDSGTASRPRWSIRGALGAADLPPMFMSPDIQEDTAESMGEGRPAGFGRWRFSAESASDVCNLESGSATVLGPTGEKALPGPLHFRVVKPSAPGARMGWIFPLSDDGAVFLAFRPMLYPTSGGALALGGAVVFFQGGATSVAMPARAVNVTGTIRFPNNQWTLAKEGLEIKGGGLQFDETGVFLMPGTEFRKDAR